MTNSCQKSKKKKKKLGGGGVTMLVSEIKSIGNVTFLEGLIMSGEISFLATRNKSYVGDSR